MASRPAAEPALVTRAQRAQNRRSYWRLETRADLERARKTGAACAAFMVIATLLMVFFGAFPSSAVLDAGITGVFCWFMLTTPSRIAAGGMLALFILERAASPETINTVAIIMLIGLVQAFRATLKWHHLVTLPQRAAAADAVLAQLEPAGQNAVS
jgi:hypothetical protein